MKVIDVYRYINSFAPFSDAEKWDNSGLLVGGGEADVKKAVVCLDADEEAVTFAVENGANLIISHHPVIFSPLSTLTADSVVYKAVKNDISVISAHTNLDKATDGVNDTLCEVLGFDFIKIMKNEGVPSFLNICTPAKEFTAEELASYLGKKLSCRVFYVKSYDKITKIALCTGAGADFIDDAVGLSCDAFITGEASYHKFLYAKEKGISLFAVGHFESEVPVVKKLTEKLNSEFNCTDFVECPSQNSVITVK